MLNVIARRQLRRRCNDTAAVQSRPSERSFGSVFDFSYCRVPAGRLSRAVLDGQGLGWMAAGVDPVPWRPPSPSRPRRHRDWVLSTINFPTHLLSTPTDIDVIVLRPPAGTCCQGHPRSYLSRRCLLLLLMPASVATVYNGLHNFSANNHWPQSPWYVKRFPTLSTHYN